MQTRQNAGPISFTWSFTEDYYIFTLSLIPSTVHKWHTKTLHSLRQINPEGFIVKFKSPTTEAKEVLTGPSQAMIWQLTNQMQTLKGKKKKEFSWGLMHLADNHRNGKDTVEMTEEGFCQAGPAPWAGTANYVCSSALSIAFPQIRCQGKAAAQLCNLFIHTICVMHS